MTIKEAHKILHPDTTRKALEEIRYRAGFKSREEEIKKVEEACIVACEALEKQIPKKPIIQKMQIKDCIDQIQIFNKKICPSCGTVLCADWNFCFECGQKLDWE